MLSVQCYPVSCLAILACRFHKYTLPVPAGPTSCPPPTLICQSRGQKHRGLVSDTQNFLFEPLEKHKQGRIRKDPEQNGPVQQSDWFHITAWTRLDRTGALHSQTISMLE